MKQLIYIFLLLMEFIYTALSEETPDLTSCFKYTRESENMQCTCAAPKSTTGTFTTYWDDPVEGFDDTLMVNGVTRDQNGTQYTCRMDKDGVITSAVYTLKVSYGPTNEDVSIEWEMNRDGFLIIKCDYKNTYPPPGFSVGFEKSNGVCASKVNYTCLVKDRKPWQLDRTRVYCMLHSRDYEGHLKRKIQTGSTSVRLQLKYPPPDPPKIVNHQPGKDRLTAGDKVTCMVYWGKPMVDSVNFSCSQPALEDQDDQKLFVPNDKEDRASNASYVNSSVTIDPAKATSPISQCVCTANWTLNSRLYTTRTVFEFPIEHRPQISLFELNGMNGSLDVLQTDEEEVTLRCEIISHPPATNSSISMKGGNATEITNKTEESNDTTIITATLPSPVACTDMGVYLCTSTNGIGEPNNGTAVLLVRCPPTKPESFEPEPLPVIAKAVIFKLNAYPVPENFTYTFKGAEDSSSRYLSNCTQDTDTLYMVNCNVTLLFVSRKNIGVRTVTVENELGEVDVQFDVTKPVNDSSPASFGVVGWVIAGVVVLIAFLVLAAWIWRRKKQKASLITEDPATNQEPDRIQQPSSQSVTKESQSEKDVTETDSPVDSDNEEQDKPAEG